MLLTIFLVVSALHILQSQWFTQSILQRILFFCTNSSSTTFSKTQQELQELTAAQESTSSIDQFAQWARNQRKIDAMRKQMSQEQGSRAFARIRTDLLVWAAKWIVAIGVRIWIAWKAMRSDGGEEFHFDEIANAKLLSFDRAVLHLLAKWPLLWMTFCEVACQKVSEELK